MQHLVKVLFVLMIFLTSEITVKGQWNTNSTMDAYNTNGSHRVGINTETPASFLHVNNTGSSLPTVQLSSNDSEITFGGHSLNLTAKSTFNYVPYISWWNKNGQRQALLGWRSDVFALQLENNFNFSITGGGGKVGIGTTAPQASLHVSGGAMILEPVSGNPVLFTGTGSSDNNRYLHVANSPNHQTASGLKAGGVLIADTYSYANPDENDLVVKGNIGIGTGTGTPMSRLDVNGSARFRRDGSATAGFAIGGDALTLQGWNGYNPYIEWLNSNGARQGYMGWNTSRLSLILENGYNFTVENGNVGIGCTNPDEKLTVKGVIHSEEVKVELLNTICPDYVFEPDYDLATLAEIETYIKENKHLPEVPSAKEMEENGMNLKEMNLLLLKKVEELTLHLIEQNKTIDDQRSAIETMSRRVEQLEKSK